MTFVYAGLAVALAAVVWWVARRRPRKAEAVRREQTAGTLDDAVRLRATGDLAGARAILESIDVARGGGLRRFLRAVAAYESGDLEGARALGTRSALPGGVPLVVARLQLAAAKGRSDEVAGDDALAHFARALAARRAGDDAPLRRAATSLMLCDAELSALLLSKELGLEAPPSTPRAAERFASVAR